MSEPRTLINALPTPDESTTRRILAVMSRAESLDEHIKRVVDTAPPLTDGQRDRLRSLLRPATSPDGPGAATGDLLAEAAAEGLLAMKEKK